MIFFLFILLSLAHFLSLFFSLSFSHVSIRIYPVKQIFKYVIKNLKRYDLLQFQVNQYTLKYLAERASFKGSKAFFFKLSSEIQSTLLSILCIFWSIGGLFNAYLILTCLIVICVPLVPSHTHTHTHTHTCTCTITKD